MKEKNKKLSLQQLDSKLKQFSVIGDFEKPEEGWIMTIRKALGMNIQQLAKRVGKKLVTVREFEIREATDQIRIGTLKEIADALDCELVYTLVPKRGSLEKMVEERAQEVAKKLVAKDPEIRKIKDKPKKERAIKKAASVKAEELKNERPKFLWD